MNTTPSEPIRKPPSILETERLILRRPSLDDAPAIYESYASDPEVSRYLTWTPHRDVSDTRKYLENMIEQWKAGTSFSYIIECKFTGVLLGMIRIGDQDSKADLGYVLAKRYWGHGYMTEAVKGLIIWGFHRRHWQRIHAVCDVENLASARVMEKAGMTFEGILRSWLPYPNIHPKRARDCRMYATINRQPADSLT